MLNQKRQLLQASQLNLRTLNKNYDTKKAKALIALAFCLLFKNYSLTGRTFKSLSVWVNGLKPSLVKTPQSSILTPAKPGM